MIESSDDELRSYIEALRAVERPTTTARDATWRAIEDRITRDVRRARRVRVGLIAVTSLAAAALLWIAVDGPQARERPGAAPTVAPYQARPVDPVRDAARDGPTRPKPPALPSSERSAAEPNASDATAGAASPRPRTATTRAGELGEPVAHGGAVERGDAVERPSAVGRGDAVERPSAVGRDDAVERRDGARRDDAERDDAAERRDGARRDDDAKRRDDAELRGALGRGDAAERADARRDDGTEQRDAGERREPSLDAAEILSFQQARAALAAGRPADALAALDVHGLRYPEGFFEAERLVSRALALCELGRVLEARAARDAFLRARPRSHLRARMRAVCDDASSSEIE